MPLNLITDHWIPVRLQDGTRQVIAPWQVAEAGVAFPDWPRADLNIACLELLIGLVFMADPPQDRRDWLSRRSPDPQRLKRALEPYGPAFHLLGGPDGSKPRFMQDFEPFEGTPSSPDMLFIDSAGGNTARNNADLMVWRDRYPVLEPALAAMALYTFQDFAPSGGAGNRTSMRGGGPMVTLVDPGSDLWALIWANVPYGFPAETSDLPWTRPCRTSEKKGDFGATWPDHGAPVEAFFGQPRRLRLTGDAHGVTGVIQKPWGTQYMGWQHPLSPSYRAKVGEEWFFRHPKPGAFGYRNWIGTVLAERTEDSLTRVASTLIDWEGRSQYAPASVIVAGWAMNNMKPLDFILSRQPLVQPDTQDFARGMALAGDQIASALTKSLGPALGAGSARTARREEFFLRTQEPFENMVGTSVDDVDTAARKWISTLGRTALDIFEASSLPGLGDRPPQEQESIIKAYAVLKANTQGYGNFGRNAFAALGLEPPVKPRKTAKEAQ